MSTTPATRGRWPWPRAWLTILSGCMALLGTLLMAGAADVWNTKTAHTTQIGELREDIEVLKANRANDHELLLEVRQDVKEVLRKVDQK